MATLTYFRDFDPIDDVYFDPSGNLTITVNSSSSTQIVLTNTSNGIVTTLTGTGFTFDPGGTPTGGTITSFSHQQGGTTLGTITGASISLVSFDQALGDIDTSGDYSAMAALISAQDLTVDATGSSEGISFDGSGGGGFVISSNITIDGSAFSDRLEGGTGNDVIRPGDNDNYDDIVGSLGTDTIDFSGTHAANLQNFYALIYSSLGNGITANIDGTANTGTISSTGSFDTLIDVNRVLDWDTWGVGIIGTNQADIFNYTMADDTWIEIRPGGGNDTINVTIAGEGALRLDYSWDGLSGPSTGIVADLGTGVISNDGFGGSDTLNISGTTFRPIELRGTDFADSMTGSAQNDSFISQGGNDFIDGAGGDRDRVRYDRSDMTSGVTVDLAAGTASGSWDGVAFTDTLVSIEEIRGTRDFGDTMFGDAMNNRLQGYGGNDTLVGGDGRDTLYGGDGNDLLDASTGATNTQGWGDYIRPGLGMDTVLGHQGLYLDDDGIDISYSDVSGVGGLTLNVTANGSGTVTSGTPGLVNDTFTFAHYFEGSQDSDSMTGSTEDRWQGWVGLAGNDTIDGGGSATVGQGFDELIYTYDMYDGGTGAVTVNFQLGQATDGFGDTDFFSNIDAVRGTDKADTFFGSTTLFQSIWYRGLEGNDSINGNSSYDILDYSQDANEGGTQGINANLGLGTVVDGFGDTDTVSGIDNIYGTDFADIMTAGTAIVDEFHGEGGNDSLTGGTGGEELDGGDGDDLIQGGGGNDIIFGGANNDVLLGQTGDDEIWGDAGNDTLNGGSGNDTLEGGDGNDTLIGGIGDDTLLGQTGSDELLGGGGADWINGGSGSDVISGGQHADVLNGGGGGDIITGGPGNHADTIDGGAGSDQIGGGDGNDLLFGGTQADIISGGNGQDIVDGGQGNDTMAGGAGNDSVLGDAGLDVLIGGLGLDTLRGGNDGDTINGNGGDDMLFGDAGGDVLAGGIANDAVDGGDDNDNVRGNAGDDTVLGGDGDDTMLGDGGNDLMAGGNGNDLLIGGVGNDTLLGQTGNDVLNSGGGDDIITGGTGTDRFVFVGGFDNDTITDFVEGLETVVLGGFTLADVSTSSAGNDLVLQVAGGGDITVVNGVTDGFDVGTDVFFA